MTTTRDYTRYSAVFLMMFGFVIAVKAADPVATKPLVVFLVRHAEKVDASSDPELSPAGKQRADELANVLRDAGITHVHSTDFIRTRNTAKPLAKLLGVDVRSYVPRDLPALVKKLRKAGGRHLVVGHSTTTPHLARLLGGDPGQPIDEKGEYDRLYVLSVDIHGAGTTTSVLMRYGKPYKSLEKR